MNILKELTPELAKDKRMDSYWTSPGFLSQKHTHTHLSLLPEFPFPSWLVCSTTSPQHGRSSHSRPFHLPTHAIGHRPQEGTSPWVPAQSQLQCVLGSKGGKKEHVVIEESDKILSSNHHEMLKHMSNVNYHMATYTSFTILTRWKFRTSKRTPVS